MLKNEIKIIQQAKTKQDILELLKKIASEFGFKYFTYARVYPSGISFLEHVTIGNFPTQWLEKYQKNNFITIDPVVKHCSSSVMPYTWKNIFKNQNKDVVDFAQDCTNMGLKEGFTLGINGNFGDLSLISFGGCRNINVHLIEPSQAMITAHLLLPYLHEKILNLLPIFKNKYKNVKPFSTMSIRKLTKREKECLLWSSMGKTAYEVAIILSISEATVHFHLKNIIFKLNCSNKTHAVAKAIQCGLLTNVLVR